MLPDSRAFVVGRGAAVWNPESWVSADNVDGVPDGLSFRVAGLLQDGRVLVVESQTYALQSRAFVWNPKTMVWRETKALDNVSFDQLVVAANGSLAVLDSAFQTEAVFEIAQYVQR